MPEDHDTRRIEVWAVQYTTVTGERSAAIMESRDVAMDWVENLVRTSWAKPVLLICIPNSQFTRGYESPFKCHPGSPGWSLAQSCIPSGKGCLQLV